MQYDVIRMLALPENNLFIVGDDDQSIYRFRGARPEIMLGFSKDYPNAKSIILDVNYRSTKAVVSAARRVIERNKNRYQKEIITVNEQGEQCTYSGSTSSGRGEPLRQRTDCKSSCSRN